MVNALWQINIQFRAGTIQSLSVHYRYRNQPIRIDTVIMNLLVSLYGSTQNIHFVDEIQNSWILNLLKSRVHVYRIEYVSYRQGPYRIRIHRIGCSPYRPSPNIHVLRVILSVCKTTLRKRKCTAPKFLKFHPLMATQLNETIPTRLQ